MKNMIEKYELSSKEIEAISGGFACGGFCIAGAAALGVAAGYIVVDWAMS